MGALRTLKSLFLFLLVVSILVLPSYAAPIAAQTKADIECGQSIQTEEYKDENIAKAVDDGIGDTEKSKREPFLSPERQKMIAIVLGCMTASTVIVILLIRKGKK